jgi:hypothetical protein
VRRAALVGQINQFRDFLEVADLVDFPGVAVEERQSEHSELDLEKLPLDKSHLLLTQVLKRGKTASIVAGYAKDLTVHGFSLLNRIGRFVSKSNQLLTGIYTWWKCYFPDYSPDGQLQSPLPLNLVLTFSATLLNDVSLNGIPDSLEHYFRKFGQLGPLADPNVISHTLATNYPQLPDGHLNSTVENLKKTLDLIAADPAFARQFRTERSKNSLREAAYNGGTDNLFSLLREQAANVPREQLRENRKRMLDDTLRGLLAEALPRGANAGEQRKLFFRSWGPRLRRALAEAARDFDPSTQVDPSARVSKLLRTLLDVNFEELDPLPRNAGAPQNRRVVLDYIDRQMVKWVNSRKSQPLLTDGLTALGLTNSAELVRLLGYLSDGVTKQSVATWLIANFSRVPPGEPARHARRYLAVKIAEALRPTSDRRREYPGTSMIEATLALHNGDDESMPEYEHSYHYQYVIHPWLDEIDTLADQPVTGERPKQPGDDELVALVRDNSQLRTLTEVPDAR